MLAVHRSRNHHHNLLIGRIPAQRPPRRETRLDIERGISSVQALGKELVSCRGVHFVDTEGRGVTGATRHVDDGVGAVGSRA